MALVDLPPDDHTANLAYCRQPDRIRAAIRTLVSLDASDQDICRPLIEAPARTSPLDSDPLSIPAASGSLRMVAAVVSDRERGDCAA
jgi:hypothetical protein